jgi:hypothetical protein
VDNELDWSLVYPELGWCKGPARPKAEGVRSARNVIPKLDAMLKDAKIDGELTSLGNSIKNFESAAKVLFNS